MLWAAFEATKERKKRKKKRKRKGREKERKEQFVEFSTKKFQTVSRVPFNPLMHLDLVIPQHWGDNRSI